MAARSRRAHPRARHRRAAAQPGFPHKAYVPMLTGIDRYARRLRYYILKSELYCIDKVNDKMLKFT